MARKTREESLNTKNRILDAAELVLLEKGVGQTAMADIAEAAGMSRGAVYGHFNGKIEVCVAVCDRAFSRAVEGFDLSDERPALATLRLAASHYLHQCGEPGSMQRVLEILYMKCEQSEENAPLMRRRALYELQTLRIAKALLRRAVAAGELDASLDVHLAGVYLLSLLEGIFGSMIWTTRLRGDRWRDAEAMLDAGVDTLRAWPRLARRADCRAQTCTERALNAHRARIERVGHPPLHKNVKLRGTIARVARSLLLASILHLGLNPRKPNRRSERISSASLGRAARGGARSVDGRAPPR